MISVVEINPMNKNNTGRQGVFLFTDYSLSSKKPRQEISRNNGRIQGFFSFQLEFSELSHATENYFSWVMPLTRIWSLTHQSIIKIIPHRQCQSDFYISSVETPPLFFEVAAGWIKLTIKTDYVSQLFLFNFLCEKVACTKILHIICFCENGAVSAYGPMFE